MSESTERLSDQDTGAVALERVPGRHRSLRVPRGTDLGVPPPVPQITATVAVGLLAALLLSAACGASTVESVLSVCYGTVGFGGAFVQFVPRLQRVAFASVIGCGFFFWSLAGFVLVLAHAWSAAAVLFWFCVALSAVIHILVISRTRPPHVPPSPGSLAASAAGGLALVGLLTVVISACTQAHLTPGKYGTLGAVPITWYLGLFVIGMAVALAGAQRLKVLGFTVICCTVALSVTPPIVYNVARGAWAQKHVGVVAFFHAKGLRLDHRDIYQAWDGFFAGVAWLSTAGGDVESIARWWPLLIDLAVLFVVRDIARQVGISNTRAWMAALFVELANTVGQNYFSPQAFAFTGALIIVALTIKPPRDKSRTTFGYWLFLVAGSVSIAVSHQLTPYLLVLFLLILGAFRMTSSRWAALVAAAPAVLWAGLNYDIVREYFDVGRVGDVTTNLQSKGIAEDLHYNIMGQLARLSLVASVGTVVIVGGAVWLLGRRRDATALAACGVSPIIILAAVHYGQEDIFRIALFGVPWWALVCAGYAPRRLNTLPRAAAVSLGTGGLVLAMGSYLLATMANDYINVVRPDDLAAARFFEHSAPDGSLLVVVGYAGYSPIRSTDRYDAFTFDFLEPPADDPAANAEDLTAALQVSYGRGGTANVFVLLNEQGRAVGIADGLWAGATYDAFSKALRDSRAWHTLFTRGNTALLELAPS